MMNGKEHGDHGARPNLLQPHRLAKLKTTRMKGTDTLVTVVPGVGMFPARPHDRTQLPITSTCGRYTWN
jgi:hypothetical protein